MTAPLSYTDGLTEAAPTQLICQSPTGVPLSFQETWGDAVRVKLGEAEAIISRNEIAALAALWPVRPPT
jgi:hypothetical protein